MSGGVTLFVEWGYENHAIALTPSQWAKVVGGEALNVEGDGYCYEGEFFQDHWTFGGGLMGTLRVEYGEGLDRGVGFDGWLLEAIIEEHLL